MRRVAEPDALRRGDRGRQPRGGVGVRRPDGLPGAGGDQPAPHRGADPGRQPGQRDPPVRAGLQRAAPPPEGDRAGARAEPVRRAARRRICADAVAFARQIGYTCAGTVEFLLDERGNHVFIEMNPRIQVEHTVTEEITDVDLVPASCASPPGRPSADLGLSQDTIADARRGACSAASPPRTRPTASAPTPAASPRYRSPGRRGYPARRRHHAGRRDRRALRLDAGQADLPRPRLLDAAVARARRALAEFRIRGVSTNIPFLQAVLDDPDFRAGRVTTSFIDERPAAADRAQLRPTAAPRS